MQTIGSVLDRTKGIGQGFDFLRIALAISILCWHTVEVCYGPDIENKIWPTPLGSLGASLLPMFFALSGFLVMGSALRTKSLATFLTFRVLRIVPALSAEVFLAAVFIGALATTLPLSHYYTDPEFFRYFLNITGRVVFTLPSAFVGQPSGIVNGSLWTVPPEIACYVFLALMMLTGGYARLSVTIVIMVMLVALNIVADQQGIHPLMGGVVQQYHLFLCFVIGNLAYHLRYWIPSSAWLCAGSALLGLLLMRRAGYVNIGLVCLTYCTVYLGILRMPKLPLFSMGDYSYGVYLYGYPIQQLVVLFVPGFRTWYANILMALPVTVAFAAFSWHCIEAPVLARKDRYQGLRDKEAALSRYPVRVVISGLLVAYGAILLHWSGLDASTGFSPRAHWQVIAAIMPVVALLIAWPNAYRGRSGSSSVAMLMPARPVQGRIARQGSAE